MNRFAVFLLAFTATLPGWARVLEQTPGADQNIMIPLYDSAGALVTGATVAAGEVYLSKNGAVWAAKNDAGGCTEDGAPHTGFYRCPVDSATDLNTAGRLDILIVDPTSGHTPIPVSFVVMPTQQYDSLYGTDNLDVSVVQWIGTAPATPTTAGVPEVDVTYWAGNAATASAGNPDVNVESQDNIDFGATQKASINTEADTALTDYDPPTRAELTSDIAGVNTNVDATQTTIGVAGANLTDLGGMSTSMLAEVEGEATDALEADGLDHLVAASVTGANVADDSIIAQMVGDDATADWDSFNNTTDSLEALRLRGDAAWATGSGSDPYFESGTAAGSGAATITLAETAYEDDSLINAVVLVTSGDCAGQHQIITDYVKSTDVATVQANWAVQGLCAFADINGATYELYTAIGAVPDTTADAADTILAADCSDASTTADTLGAICTDWENAGRLDAILDARMAEASIDTTAGAVDTVTSVTGLATDAIGAGDIATGGIEAGDFAAGAIDASAIAANAIGASEIATDAIGSAEIAADAVGAAEAGFLTDSTGFQGADVAATLLDTGTTIPGTITTAQADLDTLTGTDGATLATAQANYAPATAAALTTHDGKLDTVDGIVDNILTDTGTTLPGEHAALPTAVENRTEMDSNSTQLAAIVADTGAYDTDAERAAATWGADATTQQTQGTFGQAIGDPVADTTTIYQSVATDATGDNIAVDVVAMKAETTLIVADTNELQTDDVPGLISAHDGKLDTAQADLDTLTGTDGATLATAQANYAPATATALTTHDGKLDTAQADLDTLTGTDGATLATAQANYVPATASALTTHDGKLDTVDTNVDSALEDLEAVADARDTSMRCTVDNTNFAPTTTIIQCDLADYDASAITPSVANKFTGLPICSKTVTDDVFRDCRYIIATAQGDTDTNEWKFTVDRVWTAAPDNASVLYIRQ